jgi:hypothetical protein
MAAKKRGNDLSIILHILEGWVLKNLPFVLFIGFLGIIYIANVHYAEQKIRRIEALQDDIKELRWEYMSLKSDLMYKSKKSEVERRVSQMGLGDNGSNPQRIVIKH